MLRRIWGSVAPYVLEQLDVLHWYMACAIVDGRLPSSKITLKPPDSFGKWKRNTKKGEQLSKWKRALSTSKLIHKNISERKIREFKQVPPLAKSAMSAMSLSLVLLSWLPLLIVIDLLIKINPLTWFKEFLSWWRSPPHSHFSALRTSSSPANDMSGRMKNIDAPRFECSTMSGLWSADMLTSGGKWWTQQPGANSDSLCSKLQ